MSKNYAFLGSVKMTRNGRKLLQDYLEEVKAACTKEGISWDKIIPVLEDQAYLLIKEQTKENEIEMIHAEILLNVLQKLGTPEEISEKYFSPSPKQEEQKKQEKPEKPEEKSGEAKFARALEERIIGGVCGGISEYFRLDPVLIRTLFIIGAILDGLTVTPMTYAALWIAMPRKDKTYSPIRTMLTLFLRLLWVPYRVLLRPSLSVVLQSRHQKEIDAAAASPKSDASSVDAVIPAEVAVKKVKKRPLIIRMVQKLFLAVVMLGVYLPSSLLLLVGVSFLLWGIFYPLANVGGFQFAFADLGAPGYVFAIAASSLLFLGFIFLVLFVSSFHFKSKIFGKKSSLSLFVLFVVALFASLSSLGIVSFENKKQATTVVDKEFVLPSNQEEIILDDKVLANLQQAGLTVRELKIATHDSDKVLVRCLVKARGRDQEKSLQHLQKIEVLWQEDEWLPSLKYQPEGHFHFEHARLEMVLPKNKAMRLDSALAVPTKISGTFAKIDLVLDHTHIAMEDVIAGETSFTMNHSHMRLNKSDLGKINFAIRTSHVSVQDVVGEDMVVLNERGHFHLANFQGGKVHLENKHGASHLEDVQSAFHVKNYRSHFRLVRPKWLGDNHQIHSEHSHNTIIFDPSLVPTLEIDKHRTKVKKRLRGLPSIGTTLSCQVERGFLFLGSEESKKPKM